MPAHEYVTASQASYRACRAVELVHGHEDAALSLLRLSEVDIHQLRLQSWRLELAVVLGQPHDLRLREPVLEALAVQSVRLTVDALVVQRVIAWREDAVNLEGQPTTVARRV